MRWKIILPNLIIVLAIGVSGWLYLQSYYTGIFDAQARQNLDDDRNLFASSNQLRAVKFLRTVMARARTPEVELVFSQPNEEELQELSGVRSVVEGEGEGEGEDEDGQPSDNELRMLLRQRAHRECQAFREILGMEQGGGRTPEIVAITDSNGLVVSRDVDPNAEPVGVNLGDTFSSVGRALEGNAVRDIWSWNNFLLDVAIAPIQSRGVVVGALLVGYDISNGVAQADRDMFRLEVAYMMQQDDTWNLHSASVASGVARTTLREQIGSQQEAINTSMTSREAVFIDMELDGDPYIALAGVLSSSDASIPAGYLLMASVKDLRAPASQSILIFFFALGGALLVIVVGFLLGSHFLAPVEQIEEGILRVINGDLEHRFEVRSSEFGGLAYRVNQLVAELTGEEEVEEE